MSTGVLNDIPTNLTHGRKAGDIVQALLSLVTSLLGQLPDNRGESFCYPLRLEVAIHTILAICVLASHRCFFTFH